MAWIKYFLKAIKEQVADAQSKVLKMLALHQALKDKLSGFHSQYAIHLLDIIFETPMTSFKKIKHQLHAHSHQTIYNLLGKFQEEKILREVTGSRRNKIYVFDELMKLIK